MHNFIKKSELWPVCVHDLFVLSVDLLVIRLRYWLSVTGIHTWCGCVQSSVSVWLWPFTLCLQLYETGAKDHGKRALNIPSVFEAYKEGCQGHWNALSLLFSSQPLTSAMLVTVITKPNLLKYAMLKTFVWLTGRYFTILAKVSAHMRCEDCLRMFKCTTSKWLPWPDINESDYKQPAQKNKTKIKHIFVCIMLLYDLSKLTKNTYCFFMLLYWKCFS